MQTLVYCNDLHYGAQPICRKDGYNAAVLLKFEFCLKLAKKHHAILVFGGDLFDKPNIRLYDLLILIKLLKKYKMVRIIVNRGNTSHDGDVENSPLTLLASTGILETSDAAPFIDLDGVRLIFAPNQVDPMSRDEFINEHSQNYLLTHHLIVETAAHYDHFLMEDFKTECEVVFCADYHPYQGINNYNDTIFVAPGSIARRKKTKDNIEKIPRCVLVTDKGFDFIEIPFEEDVWVETPTDRLENETINFDMGEFKKEMEGVDESLSLQSAWEIYASKLDIDDKLFKDITSKLFE